MIPRSEEERKLTWMRQKRIWLFVQMELKACRDEYNWLMRCYLCKVSNCPEEYFFSCPLPIPPDYMKKLDKRWEMARKGILPPSRKMMLKTRYLLPLEQ